MGAAREAAGIAAGEQIPEDGEVIVDDDVCVLECSDGDDLNVWLGKVMGQSCRQLRTAGDGACAIHAVFGTVGRSRQELRREHP